MSWADNTQCMHGISFSQPCDYCEIAGIKESLEWMVRAVRQNEKRLVELLGKTSQKTKHS